MISGDIAWHSHGQVLIYLLFRWPCAREYTLSDGPISRGNGTYSHDNRCLGWWEAKFVSSHDSKEIWRFGPNSTKKDHRSFALGKTVLFCSDVPPCRVCFQKIGKVTHTHCFIVISPINISSGAFSGVHIHPIFVYGWSLDNYIIIYLSKLQP